MRWRLIKLIALAAVLAFGGFLVAASGLVPVAASSGHWAVTNWFLHFTMRQSVQLRALLITPPALDDPVLVLRGAGHYASGCVPCHGAPGDPRILATGHMTPPPPDLAPKIPSWKPKELFWIVKHGVKFTGMPAWPAQQRDDEVWAVVAFMLRLPKMSDAEYRQLAHVDPVVVTAASSDRMSARTPPDLIGSCIRCHGEDGNGRGQGAFPRLSLHTEEYLYATLQAYAHGKRYSGIMQSAVAGLSELDRRRLARHYAKQPRPVTPPAQMAEADLSHGAIIAEQGIPAQGVPACVSCHGPKDAPRSLHYPRLAGQHANYLLQQLQLLQDGRRGGTAYAHLMHTIAERLDATQMRDVAAYFASLEPEAGFFPVSSDEP